jgi:23S rRNA pseudouridine1911/1915/1917 synthase
VGPAGALTRIEIELGSGRYHQIRAQLAAIGCPIAGDDRYGSGVPWEAGAIALHHRRMAFQHPVRNQRVTVEAPCPERWPR